MNEEEIKFSAIISKSLELYKENFSLLYKIVFISICITMSGQFISLLGSLTDNIAYTFLLSLVSIVVSILSIYFGGRLTISLFLVIGNIYWNRKITFSEAYKKSGELFWNYFGLNLLAGLMFIIPAIVIVIGSIIFFVNINIVSNGTSSFGGPTTVIAGLLILVGVVGVIFLIYKLLMLIPIILFKSKEQNQFKRSFELTKGKGRLLMPYLGLMTVIMVIVLGLQFGVNFIFPESPLVSFALQILWSLLSSLVTPLTTGIIVGIFFAIDHDENDFTEINEEMKLPTEEILVEQGE